MNQKLPKIYAVLKFFLNQVVVTLTGADNKVYDEYSHGGKTTVSSHKSSTESCRVE